jgi:Trk K+ transport system NAD-binding subunit
VRGETFAPQVTPVPTPPALRGGEAEIAVGDTELRAGDVVLAIAKPGLEPALREALSGRD